MAEIKMKFVVELEFDDAEQLKARKIIAEHIAQALESWVESSAEGLASEDHDGLTLAISVLSPNGKILLAHKECSLGLRTKYKL
jgi:hypothetical protein